MICDIPWFLLLIVKSIQWIDINRSYCGTFARKPNAWSSRVIQAFTRTHRMNSYGPHIWSYEKNKQGKSTGNSIILIMLYFSDIIMAQLMRCFFVYLRMMALDIRNDQSIWNVALNKSLYCSFKEASATRCLFRCMVYLRKCFSIEYCSQIHLLLFKQ